VNLSWPRSGIRGSLDAGETAVVCLLPKLKPTASGRLEIEKLRLELNWKLNENNV
jgi:hypothetical protein